MSLSHSTDGVEGSDYVNANYMGDGYCRLKAYIATQGPLVEKFNNFWRMVWEQQVTTIVMLPHVHTVAARLLQRAASSTSTVHHGAVAAGHECSSASHLQPPVTGSRHTGTDRAALVADNSSSPVQTVSARALSCCRHRTGLPQEHAISCVRTWVSEGTPIGHEQRHGRATLSAQVRQTCVQHRRPESVEQYSCWSAHHTEHCYVQKEPENIFIPWILLDVLT